MFVKDIDSVIAGAAVFAAPSSDSSHAGTVTLNVRIGRMLAAAALFVAPALVAPAHAAGFSISDPSGACASWSWSSTTSTLTCNPATSTAGAPSGCSLTANPSTITGPTNVTLTAACTTNTTGITWAWGGSGLSTLSTSGTPSVQTLSVSASTTFSATASNGAGASSQKNATVTLSTGGGGGGGGGGTIPTCDGYTGTIKMNFNYVPGSPQVVQTSQGMLPTDIMVATFTTPATIASGYGAGGTIVITDNAQNSSGFIGSLSTTPCTFTSNVKSGLLSASWSFTSTAYHLQPNTQYFLNIKGDSPLSVKLLAK